MTKINTQKDKTYKVHRKNICNNLRFGSEKDGNRGKFIGFNLVIFCYKKLKNSHSANLLANRKPH